MYEKLIERLEFARDNWDAIAQFKTTADYQSFLCNSGYWDYTSSRGMYLCRGLCTNFFEGYITTNVKREMFTKFREQCPEHASSKRVSWFYPVKAKQAKKGAVWDYDNMANYARNPHRLALLNFAIQYLKDLNVASTDEVIEE